MAKERRRYQRFQRTISVVLRERRNSQRLTTRDVSRHGLFVATERPKDVRELVRLSVELPGPVTIDVMGMVARSVAAGQSEAQHPGMGIDFFALSREAKDRWDAFVLAGQADAGAQQPSVAANDDERRRHARHVSCFLVRLRDRARMRAYYTRDISAGGTLLRTPAPGEVGPEVDMILVHPDTDEEFRLSGKVVRRLQSPTVHERAVAVAFEPIEQNVEGALLAFIETGVNYLTKPPSIPDDRLERLAEVADRPDGSPLPLVALGQAYLDLDEPQSALGVFHRALELDPECLPAHRGLYRAYTIVGQPGRAAEHLATVELMEAAGATMRPG